MHLPVRRRGNGRPHHRSQGGAEFEILLPVVEAQAAAA
jgi:hypothetical protein